MKTAPIHITIFLLAICLNVTVFAQNTGIPINEYKALVDLYNNTNGAVWTNSTNWLDTTNANVSDWYGVTVENEHVTKIELASNNLQEAIFEEQFNIPQLKVFDISDNLIDNANFYNIDSLKNLEIVNIENNKFVFKHINQLSNHPCFSKFSSNFTYQPQAKISIPQEISLKSGELLEMDINSSYLSDNDQYQWYHDESAIPNANNFVYEKQNVGKNDAGTYVLKITNPLIPELILQSHNINVEIIELVSGIPRTEYEALKSLYNSTNGDNWTNNSNWLDSLSLANDWYGVTVEDNHVIHLLLFNNNLDGFISSDIAQLQYLQNINFERNYLGRISLNSARQQRIIPDELETLSDLIQISLKYNSIQFNDLEAITKWNNYGNIKDNFTYSFQNAVITDIEKNVDTETTVHISLQNYYPSESDKYQWVKGNNPISGANDSLLIIENVDISDEAQYYCVVSNSKFPGMEIINYGTTLQVNHIHGSGIPLSEYKALKAFYFATNGDNWSMNTNWLDTTNHSVSEWYGVEIKEGHIIALKLDSNNVAGTIPLEFYNLNYLENISLAQNNISGELSSFINQLTNLRILSIPTNNLTGIIPTEIGELTQLYWLGLSFNNISGTLPDELSRCENIEGISLANNLLESEIPSSLGDLSKLRHLHLQNNNLTGTIPSNLGNLSELRVLNLSNNQLIGPVPTELNNLIKTYRVDISGNLFGSNTTTTKSAKQTQSNINRQIPDELADLIDMDTFRLGGNNLQFNDIEAIFSWKNFNEFNEFIYTPQSEIGLTKSIEAEEESSITLSIDNYYPGDSDKYQWYKNGVLIASETSSVLSFENLQKEDEGDYYCLISNTVASSLELRSKEIELLVMDKQPSAGVPKNEYNSLVDLYPYFSDTSWANNWLDTVNGSVNDWAGITVENGHVVAIDLSGLNIKDDVFNIFTAFDSLTWLNLSNNQLSGKFPTFDGSKSGSTLSVEENAYNLNYLNIANNNFVFSDWEHVADELMAIDTFIYSPQQLIGVPVDTSMYKYNNLNITIEDYEEGTNDVYSWFKNDVLLANSASEIAIENADLSNSGTYILNVANNTFPQLTLESEAFKLSVLVPLGIDDTEISEIEIYPNPASEKVFINTNGKEINLRILDIAGSTVLEKSNLKTGWLNVHQLPNGIYIFRMKSDDSSSINKKVVIQ
jgi:Leucine-rich repeat (LRR) protein